MGTAKITWLPADYSDAQYVDWMVEGATYGCYTVTPATTSAIHFTVFGESNIDGDDVNNCVYLYKATLTSAGSASTNGTGVTAACARTGGATVPTFGAPWGTPQALDPNVF